MPSIHRLHLRPKRLTHREQRTIPESFHSAIAPVHRRGHASSLWLREHHGQQAQNNSKAQQKRLTACCYRPFTGCHDFLCVQPALVVAWPFEDRNSSTQSPRQPARRASIKITRPFGVFQRPVPPSGQAAASVNSFVCHAYCNSQNATLLRLWGERRRWHVHQQKEIQNAHPANHRSIKPNQPPSPTTAYI